MSKATVRYEGALKKRTGREGEPAGPVSESGAAENLGKQPASRLARNLALAHYVERLVEDGTLKDYAEAAWRLGITRARMAQLMGLLNLSPRVQGAILSAKLMVAERRIRSLTSEANWEQQQTFS